MDCLKIPALEGAGLSLVYGAWSMTIFSAMLKKKFGVT
jgi:hypothetical protein